MVWFVRKPQYCPNCGKPLARFPEQYINKNAIMTTLDTKGKMAPKEPHLIGDFLNDLDWVFDVWCFHCKWSGEISPDKEEYNPKREKEVNRWNIQSTGKKKKSLSK